MVNWELGNSIFFHTRNSKVPNFHIFYSRNSEPQIFTVFTQEILIYNLNIQCPALVILQMVKCLRINTEVKKVSYKYCLVTSAHELQIYDNIKKTLYITV